MSFVDLRCQRKILEEISVKVFSMSKKAPLRNISESSYTIHTLL